MRQPETRWTRLLALAALLGTAACAGYQGEEPLYVLRDSMGRSVAMAGASQLGGAAPGTMLRANLSGTEQSVMVGERVGFGPRMAGAAPVAAADAEPALASARPTAALPPVTEVPLIAGAPITATPLAAPEAPATPARRPTRRPRSTPPPAEPSA